MKTILLTTNRQLTRLAAGLNMDVIGEATTTDQLLGMKAPLREADLLLVTKDIPGDIALPNALVSVRRGYPNIRILFLSGPVDFTNDRIARDYAMMVNAGIYDIYCEPNMSGAVLRNLLANPKEYKDVEYILEYTQMNSNTYYGQQENELNDDVVFNTERNNIIVFSSAKPGSGKSFVSTNVAAMIAKYGRTKKTFEAPKVLILEGDLQTLSVGTLLGVSNPQYNIKTALRRIREVVNENGELIATEEEQEIVNEFINQCCLPITTDIPNLFAIVGSSFDLNEMDAVSPYHYFYLLNIVSEMFDVVLIDANSALEHKTTGPIMQMAREVFMVVTSDYDSVKITSRYDKELASIGIAGKVRYVLNKYMGREQTVGNVEQMDFKPEDYFDEKVIAAKIPFVDQVIQYNSIYQGKPIVLDDNFDSLPVRIAITKLANTIWPMGNYKALETEAELLEREVTGKKAPKKDDKKKGKPNRKK